MNGTSVGGSGGVTSEPGVNAAPAGPRMAPLAEVPRNPPRSGVGVESGPVMMGANMNPVGVAGSRADGSAEVGGAPSAVGGNGVVPMTAAGGAKTPKPLLDEPATPIAEPDDESAPLWEQAKLLSYDIEVNQADLDTINAEPAAEEYVPAVLVFEGVRHPIGLRYKGSVGAFVGCTRDGNPVTLTPGGPKSCPKLSMKLSFNWNMPGGRFYGLKKLQFHSMNSDNSLMRDRLGYSLFREMGIASPRAVHARVAINGQFAGLFVLVEQIDSRFTRAHFNDGGDGNLYKEIWPKWTDPSVYVPPALKTNENDADLSVDRVVRFAKEVQDSPSLSDTVAILSRWMDPAYVMDFIAVDRAIVHDDGMFHWYCASLLSTEGATGNNPGECSNHNYFWYEQKGFDQLFLVPWDLDLSFLGETSFIPISAEWNEPNPSCQPSSSGLFSPQQLAPSCDRLTRAWAEMGAAYQLAVQRLLDGPFSSGSLEPKLDAWAAQIEDSVTEAASLGHSPSSIEWQNELTHLRDVVSRRRAAMSTLVQ